MARWGKIAGVAVAVVIAAGAAALTWGQVARYRLSSAHPPPGILVDVAGRRMHLNCMGTGSPTVILEAGNSDFSIFWSKVQPEVATFTRVCSYDRAGLGWSDPADADRTVENMAAELDALLVAGAVEPPYVIAAHSFGGILARVVADRKPGDVRGMVLVDSSHPDQIGRVPFLASALGEMVAQFRGLVGMTALGVLATVPDQIPTGHLAGEEGEAYRAVLATTGYFEAAARETGALASNMPAAQGLMLGDMPLVVISRGRPDGLPPDATTEESAAFEATWADMQADLLTLSTDSRQIAASDSGHYVQIDQPELVIGAIRDVVERVRAAPDG